MALAIRFTGVSFLNLEPGSPGEKAGILLTDQVHMIGNQPVDPCFLRPIFIPGTRSGETVMYEILRGTQTLSIPVVLGGIFDEPSWYGPILVVTFLALFFWGIGLSLCLFVPVQDFRSRLVGLCWLLASIVMAGSLGIQSGFWGAATIMGSAWMVLSGVLITAHLYFPTRAFSARFRRFIVRGLAVFVMLLVLFRVADDWLIRPCMSFYLWSGMTVGRLIALFFLLAILTSIGLLLHHRSQSLPEVRRQVGLIIGGTVAGLGPFFILTLLPLLLLGREYLPGSISVMGLVLVPLVYGYIILQRKLIRIDFLINRLAIWFVLSLLVLSFSMISLSLITWYFHLPTELPLFGGIMSVLVALPAGSLHERVQMQVNRALYGTHYDFATVTTRFSQQLARALERRNLIDLLVCDLPQQMRIKQVALLLLEEGALAAPDRSFNVPVTDEVCLALLAIGKPVPETVLWKQLSDDAGKQWQNYAWAQLFVPIIYERTLQGLLILGERSTGDVYADQDLRLIAIIAHQAALAYANVQLVERMRGLAQQLVRADEEQRAVIARDLHDIVLQSIFFVQRCIQRNPQEAEQALEKVIVHLRRMIGSQRTLMLDHGLELALQDLVDEMQAAAGEKPVIWCQSNLAQTLRLTDEQATIVYRIAQEAIQNALKHAQAERISVILEQSDGKLRLTVEDDGTGFTVTDPDLGRTVERHYGLLGMQERAAMISGHLQITSDPGEGTSVILEIKYPESVR